MEKVLATYNITETLPYVIPFQQDTQCTYCRVNVAYVHWFRVYLQVEWNAFN